MSYGWFSYITRLVDTIARLILLWSNKVRVVYVSHKIKVTDYVLFQVKELYGKRREILFEDLAVIG